MRGEAHPRSAPRPASRPRSGPPRRHVAPIALEGGPGSVAAPVLVAAARRADAQVLVGALGEGGVSVRAVEGADEIAAAIPEAGCLLIAQEALSAGLLARVGQALMDQPAWSELPVLVLAHGASDAFALRAEIRAEWGEAQVTYLARPVAPLALVTAVHAALSARMRQFMLRDRFAREEELRRELNHRVKNILVTVQAMAKMTQRSASEDAGRFAAFQSRLSALAAVHAMLFDAPGEAMAFEDVARAILGPFCGPLDAGREGGSGLGRVALTCPDRPLKPEAAKAMALVLQELVTNALKHGALSVEGGWVELALSFEAGRARFSWREGGGPEARVPARLGYGMRYVTGALAGLFDGPVEPAYDRAGFRIEVDGPAGPLAAS